MLTALIVTFVIGVIAGWIVRDALWDEHDDEGNL